MPDTTIYARLTSHAGLTALIGDHVYPVLIPPQPLYPLCVYLRVSDVPSTTPDWTIYARDARYQVSCYATTRKEALAVSEQVIAALHSYVSGDIKRIRYENLMEIVEPGAGPNGADLYHVPVDFLVTFK